MSRQTEPPDWGDIFEHEDPGFYGYENVRFRSYCEYVERPQVGNFIVNLLGRLTHIVPHPDAGHAENGTFFKVYTRLDGRMLAELPSATDRLRRFRAFVYRIARNEVFDIVRKGLNQGEADDCEEELQRLAVQQHVLHERALRESREQVDEVLAKRLAALKMALSKLSESDRVLLLLRAEEVSYEVLADVFECSINYLRTRRCRAMKRLRALVRIELPDDPEFQNRQERRGDDEENIR